MQKNATIEEVPTRGRHEAHEFREYHLGKIQYKIRAKKCRKWPSSQEMLTLT